MWYPQRPMYIFLYTFIFRAPKVWSVYTNDSSSRSTLEHKLKQNTTHLPLYLSFISDTSKSYPERAAAHCSCFWLSFDLVLIYIWSEPLFILCWTYILLCWTYTLLIYSSSLSLNLCTYWHVHVVTFIDMFFFFFFFLGAWKNIRTTKNLILLTESNVMW